MQPTQSYHLSFERFSPAISIHSFTATEALNQSYTLSIDFTSPDADLPLADYLNQHAVFSISPTSSDAFSRIIGMIAPAPLKQWHGIITQAEKLNTSADETRYRLILEPRLAALAHHTTSRLFQNQTVPDIIAAVLKHHRFSGADYRIQSSRN